MSPFTATMGADAALLNYFKTLVYISAFSKLDTDVCVAADMSTI